LRLDNRERVNDIAFSFDGQRLYAATFATGVHVWRAVPATGKERRRGATQAEQQ
jgi:hypothetical protein